jgi:hypothetical protein
MAIRKPIFFSSNFPLAKWIAIYANSRNDQFDSDISNIKAQRIVDRIRGFVREIELVGDSRRGDWNEEW